MSNRNIKGKCPAKGPPRNGEPQEILFVEAGILDNDNIPVLPDLDESTDSDCDSVSDTDTTLTDTSSDESGNLIEYKNAPDEGSWDSDDTFILSDPEDPDR